MNGGNYATGERRLRQPLSGALPLLQLLRCREVAFNRRAPYTEPISVRRIVLNSEWIRIMRVSAGAAVCAAVLLLAGCRHPCGYVGIRAEVVAEPGDGRTEVTAGSETMRLTRALTAENMVLELAVESQETTMGPGRRNMYGHRSYVSYEWYAPILKPVAAVTVIGPLYMSFHDPHSHGGRSWRMWDYCRDVVAWFNIFSGVPTGPRKIETEERMFRSKRGEFPVAERSMPAPGRAVVLTLDNRELDRRVGGDDGRVRFDLPGLIRPEMSGADQSFRLKLQRENGTEEEFTFTLRKEITAAWLKAQSAPAQPPRGEEP